MKPANQLKMENKLLSDEIKRLNLEIENIRTQSQKKTSKLEESRTAIINLLTDMRKTEKELQKRLKYQRAISELLSSALTETKIEHFRDKLIREVSVSIGAEKCCFFSGEPLSLVSEWPRKKSDRCGLKLASRISRMSFFRDALAEARPFLLDTKKLEKSERSFMEYEGIRTALLVPLSFKNGKKGMIVLLAYGEVFWGEPEVSFTETASDVLMEEQAIRTSESELEKYRTGLEAIVEQRTKELSSERDKLNSILENIGEIFMLVDEKGRILRHNENASRILGEKIVGRELEGFCGSETGDVLKGVLSSRSKSDRLEIVLESGRTYMSSFTEMKTPRGKPAVVILMNDITDIREAQKSLARSVEERKRVDAMKDEFISMVSHELRTPLFPIKGYLESLISGELGPLKEQQIDALKVAHRNAKRLLLLVEDVLTVGKLESGKMKFYMKDTDIDELLKSIVSEARPRVKEAGLAISYRGSRVPEVKADPDRIAQVVNNYINNAIKFTPEGGISVRLSRKKGEIMVSVKDTGIGIKKKDIPKLFTKFFQAGIAPTGEKGTGLGIAISKAIVERHGGAVFVESEYGKGSTFGFTLPVGK